MQIFPLATHMPPAPAPQTVNHKLELSCSDPYLVSDSELPFLAPEAAI